MACLILGNALHAAVICSLHQRAIPVLAADRTASVGVRVPFWRKGWLVALLQRFDVILAQDSESVFGLRRLAGQSLRVELGGRIEETTDPLPCNEAERADIADTLKARPVWLAVGCPEAEEEIVLAAHAHALSYAHRLLLILAPVDMSRAPALAKRLTQHGLATALRGEDQEPEPDIQVLVVEGQSELGLWYRLSPVTYMGGSLSDTGSVRSPFEPVALGSAVVHGPKTGPYPDAYALLSEARASRRVLDGPQLCSVIADLLSPDKAAQLAHSAWAAASGGAEVAERVAAALLASLDAAAGRKAR
ncbi:MAG: 3-deoxy-D-manno-octulosonic acid transferase [Paracoccaceae bacterium]